MVVTNADTFPLVKFLAGVHSQTLDQTWVDNKYSTWKGGEQAGFAKAVGRLRHVSTHKAYRVAAVCYKCLLAMPAPREGTCCCYKCSRTITTYSMCACACGRLLCGGCHQPS